MSWATRPGLARWLVPPPAVRWRHPGPGALLTFDDGPHPEHTPAVLDRLAAVGARAVFFVLGNKAERHPELICRILDAGHAVGNHTHTHHWLTTFGLTAAWREVGRCQRAVNTVGGVKPAWHRPPMGRLRPAGLLAAWGHRAGVMMWSLDSGDWRCRSAADADACAAAVRGSVRPGDIVLFHDAHPYIGRILDAVLPDLAARQLLPSNTSTAQHPRTCVAAGSRR